MIGTNGTLHPATHAQGSNRYRDRSSIKNASHILQLSKALYAFLGSLCCVFVQDCQMGRRSL